MAEVLGIFASSVQVAGLAAQIAGLGLKIRALYQEIQDVPDDLAFRLEELHLQAGILSRSNPVSLEVAGFCERCLSELSVVLLELESQVKRSKGIRQKVASTRVALKKQLIQKLDSRLCRSVQLVQLAASSHMASSYGLILQNQDCMMSLMKPHFSQSAEPDGPVLTGALRPGYVERRQPETRRTKSIIHVGSTTCPDDSKIWYLSGSIDSTPRWARTYGSSFVTGTIRLESNDFQDLSHNCSASDCMGAACPNSSGLPTLWARFALPRWLSYRVLEVIAHRSRIGWKQYIRTRSIFPPSDSTPGTPFDLACDEIADGDLQSLRTRIDNREVTPWDEDGKGETMWTRALFHSRWEICNYLMDLGVEPLPNLRVYNDSSLLVEDIVGFWNSVAFRSTETRRAMQAELRKLIQRLDDNDGLSVSLLSGFQGSFDEFQSLRSSIWSDKRFYQPDFSQQRMRFAISIACSEDAGMAAASRIRSILGLGNGSSKPALDFSIGNIFNETIFHGLAYKIAATAGSLISADWHRLTCDILACVTDGKDLNQAAASIYIAPYEGSGSATAFTSLILESIFGDAQVSYDQGHRCPRRPSAAILRCETSIMAWLEVLQESGIDLEEYGSNEQMFYQQTNSADDVQLVPSRLSHWWNYFELQEQFCLVESLRLINFHFGKLPMDWKFWWNEPSDNFAGEFWRLVDLESTAEIMSVPGAWVN